MARGVNKVILIGNLGNDPDTRYTQGGSAIANISLATTSSWTDKNTGDKQERTEWHRVVFFGRLAEIASEYLRKGSGVYVEGRLQTRKWQDQNGNDRYTTEVVANEMQMLGGRGDAGDSPGRPAASAGAGGYPDRPAASAGGPRQTPAAGPDAPPAGGDADSNFADDDIPF